MDKKQKLALLESAINAVKENKTDKISTILFNAFDGNTVGELTNVKIGSASTEIESIWSEYDGRTPNIMLHVNHYKFEGDIILTSLPDKEILKVLRSLKRNTKACGN